MGAQRRAGKRTYLPIGNGQHVHIPNISSPHHFKYFVIGIKDGKPFGNPHRIPTLSNFQIHIDAKRRIEFWSLYDGYIDGKFVLNYETGNWDQIGLDNTKHKEENVL